MSKQRSLLFVGAHPDDETFGVGGTLALYAALGVKVYYACATRGEAGSVSPEQMKGYATVGEMRWAELECAARVLGLSGVVYLGYRDSGMEGSEDNKHPEALAAAPLEQATGRVVKVIREVKPEVVITFDPIGGYRHPDHIAVHEATVKAFHAAGDPAQYPQAGPVFEPRKLYFGVFSRRMLKVAVRLMPLFGQDPHRFGRNKDIDIASVANLDFPIHAAVRLTRQAVDARDRATACHASQMGGRPLRSGPLGLISGLFGQRDFYMRAYPTPEKQGREADRSQECHRCGTRVTRR